MIANGWSDFAVSTSAIAQSPSGNYFYHLTVEADNAAINSLNAFKVRVEGGLRPSAAGHEVRRDPGR